MIVTWFNIYNKATFEAEDIPSKNIEVTLGDLGPKEIMLTKGSTTGVVMDDVFLLLNLNEKNPFFFDDMIVYVDEDDEIFLGVFSDED